MRRFLVASAVWRHTTLTQFNTHNPIKDKQIGIFHTSTGYFNNVRYKHQDQNNDASNSNSTSGRWGKVGGSLAAFTIVGYFMWNRSSRLTVILESSKNEYGNSSQAGSLSDAHNQALQHLPFYSSVDVANHYNSQKGIWVSFRRGVYDVTDFVAVHPGGSRILMAAGGALEPFWELYPVHQKSEVFSVLEKYRIGNLLEEDVVDVSESIDHFKGEPKRHPALIRRSEKPFNGETPPSLLSEKFYTPNEMFYVRNHLPVPSIDVKAYRLEIEGINLEETSFSLEELKKFPKFSVSATIQCGGNRRTEMGVDRPVAGLGWMGGAIGNAKWTGVRLIDVLKGAKFNSNSYKSPENLHVQFDGMDMDQSGECYGASIPLSYLLDGNFDAVLAFEMNDKPLPIDHGFPVRIILPGIVGARSVKWLSKITISDKESDSPWQQRDYKVFSPSVSLETVDFTSAPAITDTPVTSYICSHENNQNVHRGNVTLQGYAFSGGGRKIVRVEVSFDKGNTWQVARISKKAPTGDNSTRNWSWVLWESTLYLEKDAEIWVKAVDSGYNQQPEEFKNIWNYRGLLSTAFHKINLRVN